MADVAEAAGVARSTASAILANRDCFAGADARRRVREAAEELLYIPNRMVRGVKRQRRASRSNCLSIFWRLLGPAMQ